MAVRGQGPGDVRARVQGASERIDPRELVAAAGVDLQDRPTEAGHVHGIPDQRGVEDRLPAQRQV